MRNLSPVKSLRERRLGGRESSKGPKQLGLYVGLVYCKGVQSDCGPLLFGDRWFEIVTFGTTKIATWHINCILGKINKNK